jgi:peptide/nickel transport system substrate-binding protein
MKRDPNWWADKVPGGHPHLHAYPDSVVFKVISDQTTATNALRSELVDVAPALDANTFIELKENDYLKERFDFLTTETFSFFFVAMNNKHPMLEDKRVRRAMAHLLDVQTIIDRVYAGLAVPVAGPVSPAKAHVNKDLALIEKDIEKAKALLVEAGWEDTNGNGTRDKMIDGELTEMEMEYIVTPGSKFAATLSELLKDGANQVGISIDIITREPRVMIQEDLANRDYFMYGYGAGGNQLLDDFTQLWHTSSNSPRGSNRWQFGNAETDALIDEINETMDVKKRTELYREFQQIIYDEQPLIFLFAPQERVVVSKRFEGNASRLLPNYRLRDFKLVE